MEQASFNFMAAVTICSDFGAQENTVCHCFHCFLLYLPWSDVTRCHDLSFLNVVLFRDIFIVEFNMRESVCVWVSVGICTYILCVLTSWLLFVSSFNDDFRECECSPQLWKVKRLLGYCALLLVIMKWCFVHRKQYLSYEDMLLFWLQEGYD